jgi:RNA polymerase sigma-70 factor (ECF subfamily)
MSYEETAKIVGTNIGTVKSRMNRARLRLAELLHIESKDDLGSDRLVSAIASGSQRGSPREAA